MDKVYKRHIFSFLGIVILVALNNNCFEYLTNHNISASQILFYRGLFTLIVMSAFGMIRKKKIFPVNVTAQSVRIITTGGSLFLVLESYAYLSAGTVSLLQRLDIPFLIFISLLTKNSKKTYQVVLSAITIIAVLILTIEPSLINEDGAGFLLVFGSVGMTAIGYLTVHKGSDTESVPALVNVAAISWIAFGAFSMAITKSVWIIPQQYFLIILLSAVANILLFYITVELYKMYAAERALLPFVLAIFSTSVVEMLIERKMYAIEDILIKAGLTLLICSICIGGQKVEAKKKLELPQELL